MIFYIFGFFILLIILFYIFIRLKYKFWCLQPVFHIYDIYYWFINVGIINKELPNKNRYVNQQKIKTKTFEEIDELTKKQIYNLIRLNYFRNNDNKYDPHLENIVPYFLGHNSKTYWSYYIEPELLINNKNGKIIDYSKIIGIITSRPLHVKINSKNFDVYYVDYLCVDKLWRKKNIAPQLIQTHEYNQSYNNRKISVSLFKREEELTGIIPLTVYNTYCFSLSKIKSNSEIYPGINLLTGDKQNIYYFYNFLKECSKDFNILIYPEITNLIELISTKNIFIKMTIQNGNIKSVYIFKKTCTYITKDKEILSCICSFSKISGAEAITKELFIYGFKESLLSILKENNNFGYLSIEDISDNHLIINDICLNLKPIAISPMGYFFYNFAYHPFKSEKCIIIN